MRTSHNLFPFIVAIPILLLSFWMDAVTRLITVPAQALPQTQPDLVAHDIRMSLIGAHDQPEAVLTAPLLKHFQNNDMEVTTPLVTYFGADNSVEISSPSGTLMDNNQTVMFSGGVKAVWNRQASTLTMTTDTLTADVKSGTVKSTSPVIIQQGRSTLSGSGLSFDKNTSHLEMSGPITGILYPQDHQ